MDLEQLTKHQILLLTLLVSFVTSIATGIVTVSLMDQAPEGVTRVINQIVERTVETVTPASQGAAAVATEKTVVVKQDELVPQSIAAVQRSVVRIVAEGSNDLIARGIAVAPALVVTDREALTASGERKFEAILYSGERVSFDLRREPGSGALVFGDLGTSTTAATLIDPSKLTLGQTVVRISGNGGDMVGEGVIASLSDSQSVQASVTSDTPGSVLITIFGEIIGIATPSPGVNSDTYTIISLPTSQSVTNTGSSS